MKNTFRACFVGLGSIAKRHIRNLHQVCQERGLELQADVVRRSPQVEDSMVPFIHSVYTSVESLPNDYDAVFITNPTEFHLDTLAACHSKGKHFFITLPEIV